ncbi:hypothetical protein I6G25_11490 (plasmid) [Macrococcoides caseolyticum]|uniref:hypothetical protein n=1 Tax=Macrococcoides caseolyticum TaxID=69966 RepID=UPI000CD094FC|nr:hypothetical protein [Macrococcus caseolyticus]PNZ73033.1 hypothetical protein CD152_06260 [Macrococcus caseolyticus]QPT47832.1 hypothetical protein I6G25_11490 [Macrococcus caseolyticus]
MKKIVIGGLLGLSLILTACGSNQEGDAALKGKTFEATQGGDNEYLLTFRDDGTLQVKENGNLGRTDEGEYKVSEEKSKDGYYHVTFDKLKAGYIDQTPDAGYWALDKDNNNNLVLRYVDEDCRNVTTDNPDAECKVFMPFKEKGTNDELDDSEDVYLKEK